jgi:lysophospholipase L1-like esterase
VKNLKPLKLNKKQRFILVLLCFQLIIAPVIAQPFAEDIGAFKKRDSVSFPPGNAILFVGSSSFTKWTNVQDYFPAYKIINRGFGGSSLTDVIRYAGDIIFPYQPKQIVIYCGENDLAASDTITSQIVFNRFVQLFEIIRRKLPEVPVTFISLKPSPSRWNLRDKMIDANKRIKQFLKKKNATVFIDVYHHMLDAGGNPIKEIFLDDHLHMNEKGYKIWQELIEPYLLK